MTNIQSLLGNIQLGAASGWDIFLLVVFVVAIFIYAYSLGKNRIVLFLLSSYFAYLILQAVPWDSLSQWGWLGIGDTPSPSIQILIFLGLILAFFFLIPRSILSSILRVRKRGDASFPQLLLLGIVQIGFLTTVILSLLPVKEVSNLGLLIRNIFVGSNAKFVWIVLSVFVISLMKRPRIVE